jgi:ATP-dependent DNA ligase
MICRQDKSKNESAGFRGLRCQNLAISKHTERQNRNLAQRLTRCSRPTKSRRQYVLQSRALEVARELEGARAGKYPAFVEPMLATLNHKPPSTPNWVHEIKYDG